MAWFTSFCSRARSLLHRRSLDADMAEEMRFHLEQRAAAHRAAGLSAAEARHAARRAFGHLDSLQETARDERGTRWLSDFAHDLRHGFRLLRRHPGFTCVAIITLALGIGANTAIFSAINAALLRPLPFPEPGRLARIWETTPAPEVGTFSVSYPTFHDWRQRTRGWDALAATTFRSLNLTGAGEPEYLLAHVMSSTFLPMLGWQPALGRGFGPDDDTPGKNRVAILSHALWKRVFDADPRVLGRAVVLNGEPHTVIGVAPAQASPILGGDLFLPLGLDPAREDRSDHDYDIYGKLRPGVSLDEATAELRTLSLQIGNAHPESNRGWSVRTQPLFRTVVGATQERTLLLLFGSVGFLLLIACANLSGLLLVRITQRGPELAVRAALGGSRARLLRQLLAESVLVAALGGTVGVLVAVWGVDLLRTFDSEALARAHEITVDGRVLAFTGVATLFAGIVTGLLPAWQGSRLDLQTALKQASGRTATSRRRWRDGLIIAQIALTTVLLAAAGLLGRSLDRLHRTDLGFAPKNVLTFRLGLAPGQRGAPFFTTLLERLGALPGVGAVGVTNSAPMAYYNTSLNVHPVGPARVAATEFLLCEWRIVSADYFRALGVPLVRGRFFTPGDNEAAPNRVLINQTLARRLWGDEDPIGRQINPGGGDDYSTVIGVVGDLRSQEPGARPAPAFYLPVYRGAWGQMTVVVRGAGDARSLLPALRREVKALDPTLPIAYVRMLDELVQDRLAQPRLRAGLLGAFAGVALLLAAVGLYGVMAAATALRTREIGIRRALGAQTVDVVRPLIRQAAMLVGTGLALGLLLAFGASPLLRGLLIDISPRDPWTFVAVSCVLGAAALLACYLPARRATQVDPVVALRSE